VKERLELPPFVWVVIAMAFLTLLALATLFFDLRGHDLGKLAPWSRRAQLGHVTRAYGTVRLNQEWRRLDSSHSLLEDLFAGDQLQTGEHSAAQVLFFGGSRLELEAGSVVRVEGTDDEVKLRLLLGRAYFEFAGDASAGPAARFRVRGAEGKDLELPEEARVVLGLNAAESLEGAVELNVIDAGERRSAAQGLRARSPEDLELRLLAQGSEVVNLRPLIVPPIEDAGRGPAVASAPVGKPRPVFPRPEALVDVERDPKIAFSWKRPPAEAPADPIIGYEIIVRPAFNYEVEDRARIVQVFKARSTESELPIEKVNGSGVFLWSVRAVTASGARGPASSSRWLEIKFPKLLRAPELMKPNVK
jgi:hypothetical protein